MDQDYTWIGLAVVGGLLIFVLGFWAGMRLSWSAQSIDRFEGKLNGMRDFLGTTLKGTRRRIARIEAKLDAFGARQAELIEQLQRQPEQEIGEPDQPE
jgi:hypothetical protein